MTQAQAAPTSRRPTGVAVLSVLWLLGGFLNVLAFVSNLQTFVFSPIGGRVPVPADISFRTNALMVINFFGLPLAVLSVAVAFGLWRGRRWSYNLGLALPLFGAAVDAAFGLVLYTTDGPFVMVPTAVLLLWAAVVWVYLRRPYVKGFLGVGVL